MYEQAVQLYDAAVEGAERQELAAAQVKRGVLLDRLGRHAEATTAFRAAFAAAPRWREGYLRILSHLVSVEPDVRLAHEVFRRAQQELPLAPEWKVYLALWVKAIAARAHTEVEPDVTDVLSSLSSGDAWWGKLAKFGAGQLPYADLYAAADGRGEQTEAAFYEGARLLGAGDVPGARVQFERVLQMSMVSFYEYEMAQRLLGQLPAAAAH